ncbi:hypothetical protein FACS189446_8640 [Bacteroidia bacterium]|nr:hypothetical protein FACS189446_8640 [Bacteroidia bacterium]
MELKDFICETIKQISDGVSSAREKCACYGTIVNPEIIDGKNGNYFIPDLDNREGIKRSVQMLDMDIAVTVTESIGGGGKADGKISVSAIGFGLEGNIQKEKSMAHESHVKFSIPICLPTHYH